LKKQWKAIEDSRKRLEAIESGWKQLVVIEELEAVKYEGRVLEAFLLLSFGSFYVAPYPYSPFTPLPQHSIFQFSIIHLIHLLFLPLNPLKFKSSD
jgi:hypothetical protein